MAKTITFPVSNELHTKFKQYCIGKDIDMRDACVLAIQIIVNKKK